MLSQLPMFKDTDTDYSAFLAILEQLAIMLVLAYTLLY